MSPRIRRLMFLLACLCVLPVLNLLSTIHSGLIGDYVAWLMLGLALFTLAFAAS